MSDIVKTDTNDSGVSLTKFNAFSLKSQENKDSIDYAMLQWSVRERYPRITVFLSSIKGTNGAVNYDNMITAPFDYITLSLFFKKAKQIIMTDKEDSYKIDCLNTKFDNGRRTSEIYVQATVSFGKDADGTIWVMVTDGNKKQVKFEISPVKWFRYYDEKGNEIKDQISIKKEHARAYIDLLEKTYEAKAIADFTNTTFIGQPQYKRNSTKPIEQSTQTQTTEAPKLIENKPVDNITYDDGDVF